MFFWRFARSQNVCVMPVKGSWVHRFHSHRDWVVAGRLLIPGSCGSFLQNVNKSFSEGHHEDKQWKWLANSPGPAPPTYSCVFVSFPVAMSRCPDKSSLGSGISAHSWRSSLWWGSHLAGAWGSWSHCICSKDIEKMGVLFSSLSSFMQSGAFPSSGNGAAHSGCFFPFQLV